MSSPRCRRYDTLDLFSFFTSPREVGESGVWDIVEPLLERGGGGEFDGE